MPATEIGSKKALSRKMSRVVAETPLCSPPMTPAIARAREWSAMTRVSLRSATS
ncbi:hypothetical protein D3C78_1762180 [compost metagenome]